MIDRGDFVSLRKLLCIGMDRNQRRFHDRSHSARPANVRQIARKPVAEIDHRARLRRQFPPQRNPRLERQMPAMNAPAQRPRDKNMIPRLRAAARHGLLPRRAPEDRHAHHQLPVPRRGISAHDRAFKRIPRFAKPAIELLGPID